jgi:hypothetical protein
MRFMAVLLDGDVTGTPAHVLLEQFDAPDIAAQRVGRLVPADLGEL